MPDPVKFAGLVFTLHAQIHTPRHKHMHSCTVDASRTLTCFRAKTKPRKCLNCLVPLNTPSNLFALKIPLANKFFYNYFFLLF